jgi:hypothetical protein
VDFRMEGKNKVFHLKRTIEGRNAAMIAEIYKQSSIVSKWPWESWPSRCWKSCPLSVVCLKALQ